MLKKLRFTLVLMLLLGSRLSAQLTLRLVVLPEGTPENSNFFVAGSFNGWSPDDPAYQLLNDGNNIPEITLALDAGTYEYKFTRGGWNTVEGNAQGGFLPNRNITYDDTATTVNVIIQSWEDVSVVSSAAPNVSVIDDNFYMPQLNRYRRIWIYLPPNYASTTQSYPVLYMHDGQNLFDASTSFAGEWEVDESLNQFFENGNEGIIVIGIDNDGAERINEYTPWPNRKYGGGDGEAYVDFIVQTLKPYIDANYRTKTEPEYTGIMGSSLGGLISLYSAIAHQDVFGRVGVFSPSLWFTDDIYEFVSNTGKQQDMRIFLMVGELEGTADVNVVEDLQRMYSTLQVAGFGVEELIISTHADGEHSERYWAREFLLAYKWLFDDITFIEYSPKMEHVRLWPLPVTEDLHIENLPETDGLWNIRVVNCRGRTVLSTVSTGSKLSVWHLANGYYFIVITDNQGNILIASLEKT